MSQCFDGERIFEVLEQTGMTQTDLARLLQVDRTTVWRWIKNHHEPRATDVATLAAVLSKPVAFFYRKTAL